MDFNVVVPSCAVRTGFDRDIPNFVVLRSILSLSLSHFLYLHVKCPQMRFIEYRFRLV